MIALVFIALLGLLLLAILTIAVVSIAFSLVQIRSLLEPEKAPHPDGGEEIPEPRERGTGCLRAA